tara:strand:- start:25566 stop:34079 length:8514 start_codon:yes stop_codon:yes gene_type:complete
MPDNLTLRVQEELRKRGKIVSQDDIARILQQNGVNTQQDNTPQLQALRALQGGPSLPGGPSVSNIPSSTTGNTALNALGATLWSFADTFAFGVPGALTKEEEFIDFQDPWAKTFGAVGGFAGFVTGAPMKVGAKAVAQIAKPFITRAGKESADTMVRGIKKNLVKAGIDKKWRKDLTKGYTSLVRGAQKDPAMQGKAFKEASETWLNRFVDNAVARGDLTDAHKQAIIKAFGDNYNTRPLQDFIGLIQARGILKDNPRLARVLGHSINDALMFGMIDGIFEGVSMYEDNHYDWTAPIWGVGTGAMFGQLSWLNPKGKGASWFRDFKHGVRAAFQKDVYKDKPLEYLISSARFLGESAKNHGASTKRTVNWKGKDVTINFNSKHLDKKIESLGFDGKKILLKALEQDRRYWGREMMKWSTGESLANMQENWFRMTAGGILFNAHTFYDMYAHDFEADVADILPHFLIGAYVQRHANPAKWDIRLKSNKINQVRENLMLLGYNPEQLREIPSFRYTENRLTNPLSADKFQPLVDFAKNMDSPLIADRAEDIEHRLPPGEISVKQKPNNDFNAIYRWLISFGKVSKDLDSISVKEAEAIVREFRRIEPKGELSEIFDKAYKEKAKDFESILTDLVEDVRNSDVNGELGIHIDPANPKNNRLPFNIEISEALLQKARNGELDWIKDSKNPETDLIHAIEGLVTVSDVMPFINKGKTAPDKKVKVIESEELLRSAYEIVKASESNVMSMFPDKSFMADRFSYRDSASDYVDVAIRNSILNSADLINRMFSKDFAEYDKMSGLMREAGLVDQPFGRVDGRLINSTKNIEITGAKEGTDQASEAKRFLNRVLTLSSLSGTYKKIRTASTETIKVDINRVNALKEFMAERGYDVKFMKDFVHEAIADYMMKERIKGTELQLWQVDGLMSLSEMGFAQIGLAVKGKTAGFTVMYMDEAAVPRQNIKLAREYNNQVKKLIDDGKGLVIEDTRKIQVFDEGMAIRAKEALKQTGQASVSARATLVEFMNVLSPRWEETKRRMNLFMAEGGTERLTTWLQQAGVIQFDSKKKSNYTISVEKFNEALNKDVLEKIERYGVSRIYAEAEYQRWEKQARDAMYRDLDEVGYKKHITLQDFFKKYRIRGEDVSEYTSEERLDTWDKLVYESKDRKLLHDNILDHVLKEVHVEKDGKFIPFKQLPKKEQKNRMPEITGDLIGLFATQRAQVKVGVIKFQNGRVIKSEETQQVSRLSNFLNDNLKVPFRIVDSTASFYELADGGRYTRLVYVDAFGENKNLTPEQRKSIRGYKNELNNTLNSRTELFGENIKGENNEIGVHAFRLFPEMNAIAVEMRHFKNVEKPFLEFAKLFETSDAVSANVKRNITQIRESFESDIPSTPAEYEFALRLLTLRDMLHSNSKGVGGGGKKFLEVLNSDPNLDMHKTLGRVKLYNTKRFVRNDVPFAIDVARAYEKIGDKETYRVFRKFANKKGFGVAIWNDAEFAKIRDQVEKFLKDNKIENWNFDVIGDGHLDTSAFDSIAFVSKDVMRYGHTSVGHNPNSLNPFKPIISSAGNSPLLYGKTLFIYTPELENFFKKNPSTDILLTKTGAKLYNETVKPGQLDPTIINAPYEALTGESRGFSSEVNRKISLDSLGILPSKDAPISNAPRSQSDYNFMTNAESGRVYEADYRNPIEEGLRRMSMVLENPIGIRKWVMDTVEGSNLMSDPVANVSAAQFSSLIYWAGLSRDANPMSHSPRKVKNQLFDHYLNNVINNMRSKDVQYDNAIPEQGESVRYGGQSVLVQIPTAYHRLKSSLVRNNGEMIVRGEVMLPAHEAEMSLRDLTSNGRTIRFVRNGEILKPEDVFKGFTKGDVDKARELWKEYVDYGNLGTLHEMLETHIKLGDIPKDTQIGIIVNRKPRTRPNDMTIVGLKGFLEKAYGNSATLGSLDVVNVFEGDYDADKIDYFMSSRRGMYDHVERSSKFFVQGIDPSKFRKDSSFNFGGDISSVNAKIGEMAASSDLFKRSIGAVQKIPRKLGFIEKLAYTDLEDGYSKHISRVDRNGNKVNPKILFSSGDAKIMFDYSNLDFFTRAALETQFIIDGTELNHNIAKDMSSWSNRFLFPTKSESIHPGEQSNNQIGFVNNVRREGHSNGKRVRIFRKVEFDRKTGEYREVDLNNAEMAVIKELLSEYGKLLNASGKKMWEKSGSKKSINYDDMFTASGEFADFVSDINKSVFDRLKNRNSVPGDPSSKKWKRDDDFINLFGVRDATFKNREGKKIDYSKSTIQPFDTTVKGRGVAFAKGDRGAPLERILMRIHAEDVFGDRKVSSLTGDIVGYMDTWYKSMIAGDALNSEAAAKDILREVQSTKNSVNKRVKYIQDMKRKWAAVGRNTNIPYKSRKAIQDKMNKDIKDAEQIIWDWLPDKYKKSKKSKDLKTIEFQALNNKEAIEGAIQFATMRQFRKTMPFIGDSPTWGLGAEAQKLLKHIKMIRGLFYSNRDSLKDIKKYGDKTLYTPEIRELLKHYPDLTEYYKIETDLLTKGLQKYGQQFIYAFMSPVENKYAVGVFEGSPIPVPYGPTTRYSRGLQFLSETAQGIDVLNGEVGAYMNPFNNTVKSTLRMHQLIEKRFSEYFNKENAMRDVRYDMKQQFKSKGFELDANYDLLSTLEMTDVRLPSFNKSYRKTFTSFRDIKWSRDTQRKTNGMELTNDYLLDFYADIMKAAGKEKEWQSYLNSMSDLSAMMMKNEVIDPMDYIAKRSLMDKDMIDVARRVLTNEALMGENDNLTIQRIKNNPVYALIGGSNYFKGLSFEKSARFSPERLKSLRQMQDTLEMYDHKLNIKSTNAREKIEKLKQCFPGR